MFINKQYLHGWTPGRLILLRILFPVCKVRLRQRDAGVDGTGKKLSHPVSHAVHLGIQGPRVPVFVALKAHRPEDIFSGKELALLRYTAKLTGHVGRMVKSDYDVLVQAGCDDAEILEVNQVCAYFNYSNRLLNGLGCTTDGDVIGYYSGPD